MPDKILLIIFGVLSTLALVIAGVALYFAVKNAKKKDGEIKMALWSFVALAGFVFAGMCWAYFLIPILINNLFR
jgi:heme/copper-type cytochrome/quinol oxidase subunit 3